MNLSLSFVRRNSQLARQQIRQIQTGTDLKKSTVTWQTARPWHMNDSQSNLAKDNEVSMEKLFKGKSVVVFGVPAPFTGVCTHAHYPPYKALQDKMKVDEIVCYSVADPYSLYNWGKSMGNDFSKISFLADVDCEWAKENELDRDYTGASLGVRSERFSMYVVDGIVQSFNFVKDAENDAEKVMSQIK